MPQKTRKEKQLANIRRQQRATTGSSTREVSTKTSLSTEQLNEDAYIRKYFMIDFRKSIMLIVMICVLEIAFYFAYTTGLLNRYLPL